MITFEAKQHYAHYLMIREEAVKVLMGKIRKWETEELL